MRHENGHCATVPEFDRLNYFYGQLLGPAELHTEQAFFREKLKLHNRCLHGYGIVCGLEVVAVETAEPCPPDPCTPEPAPARIEIRCGVALDCHGNELVVRHPILVDLWCALDAESRRALECGADTLYVSLCYREQPIDPSRPALPDACAGTQACHYAKLRDCLQVTVSTRRPHGDERCESCCEPCNEPCLLLATICEFKRDTCIEQRQIDTRLRRMLTRYEYVTVSGVNWLHGYTYRQEAAHHLLRSGLVLTFSRKVRTATIRPGVADIWVVEGGEGRSAAIYNLEGELLLPNDEYTDRVIYRQRTREGLQDGDRVLFTLRTEFILDHCCQPVDGENVGGLVRYIGEPCGEEVEEWLRMQPCRHQHAHHGRRTSGNMLGGGVFQSWFFVSEDPNEGETDDDPVYERRGYASTRGGRR